MTLERKILIGVATVLVIESSLGIGAYIHQRKAGAVAQAKEEVHQQVIEKRDQAAQVEVVAIEKKVDQANTPAQAAEGIGSFVVLPEAIRPVAVAGRQSESSDAPSAFVLPKADVLPILQGLARGKQNQVLLEACTQDLEDLKAQRDGWKKAYRGGNWAVRAARNPKVWAAIGGILGFELGRKFAH